MKNDFITRFESIKEELIKECEDIKQRSKDKKDMITKIKKSSNPAAIFCLDKGQNCDAIIWRFLKPSK